MCGRFTLQARWERLMAEFAAEFALDVPIDMDWSAHWNISPTHYIPAIREQKGQFGWTKLRWGLIPSWAKDTKIAASLINARAETVAEKPSFRAAFKRRRCLLPADGFYEWRKNPGSKIKTPFYITLRNASVFAFAGLWETWQGEDGTRLETCTIITTTPNELMQELHDRMPVILPRSCYTTWLNPHSSPEDLQSLLVPYAADEMQARAIEKVGVDLSAQ